MKLEGKTALITGAALRIGREIALALARSGIRTVVHYRNSGAEAAALVQEIKSAGVEAWAVQADLTSEYACRDVVARAIACAGSLDILVNNASVFEKHSLAGSDEAAVMGQFWPNLFAPLFLMRAFAEKVGQGSVVNLLDQRISGLDATCIPYLLSKKGLAELTRLAAIEGAPNIRVNGVAPGAILPPPGEGPAYLKEQAGPVPLDRQVTPAEIAAAVVYLLEQPAITGQIIFVDGGQHLAGCL